MKNLSCKRKSWYFDITSGKSVSIDCKSKDNSGNIRTFHISKSKNFYYRRDNSKSLKHEFFDFVICEPQGNQSSFIVDLQKDFKNPLAYFSSPLFERIEGIFYEQKKFLKENNFCEVGKNFYALATKINMGRLSKYFLIVNGKKIGIFQ